MCLELVRHRCQNASKQPISNWNDFSFYGFYFGDFGEFEVAIYNPKRPKTYEKLK